MEKREEVTLEGKSYYASVHTPNQTAGAFVIDVQSSNKAQVDVLLRGGLKAASKADGTLVDHDGSGNPVFRFKRKLVSIKTGKSLGKPIVVDSQVNPMNELIGNGSDVIVKGSMYPYSVAGKTGTALGLNSVQVVNLVRFAKGGLTPIAGGFVTSGLSSHDETESLI